MKRGDIVTVALSGDFGKPRPALVVQADQFTDMDSITFLLITSTLVDSPILRVPIVPTPENGLRNLSQIMVDKTMTANRSKIGSRIGLIDDETMLAVTRSLALFLGFG